MVLGLLFVTIALFVYGKPRMDVVALLVIIALPLTGLIDVQQAIAGFSDPNVILIAALFVIGDGLVRTGVAYRMGSWLVQWSGSSETRLLVLLMLATAGLGSVMSSTGVVAIFIPVALSIAARMNIPPRRLMMPLAFAGLISGMLSLVATPPNLVVHAELLRSGFEGFGFFTVTPIGLVILAMGIGYMLVARRWLSQAQQSTEPRHPRLTLSDLIRSYRLNERECRLRVCAHSRLVNQQLNELELRKKFGINVIAVERRRKFQDQLFIATGNTEILSGDILLVDLIYPGDAPVIFYQTLGLESLPLTSSHYSAHSNQLGLAEVALPPESKLLGKTVQEVAFRSRHQLNVVGLRRHGEALDGVLMDEKLKDSDTLLVAGDWRAIHRIQGLSRDFIVLSLPAEIDNVAPAARKAPFALMSLLVMIVLMIGGWVANVIAALIACLLMGAGRCITLDSAYRSIHWPTLILIIGMLPFAQALSQTGGIGLAVQGLVQLFGGASHHVVLAALFALTAVIGLFISNTATAVLLAPVAISAAQAFDVSPYPFAMTVAVAASSAFMTPISSPVNTLVLGPGQYKFGDFVRVGVPFTVLVMIVSVLLIPLLLPFK